MTHLFFYANSPESYRHTFQKEHRRILAACRTGDLPGALASLETHLRDSCEAIIALTKK